MGVFFSQELTHDDQLALQVALTPFGCSRCGEEIQPGSTVGELARPPGEVWWFCLECAPIVLLSSPANVNARAEHPEIVEAILAGDPLNRPTEGEG